MNRRIAILTIGAALFIWSSVLFAADRLVPGEYSTIQAAIDDCNDGDVVIIEPNTYTGTGNRDIDFLGKAITVRSIDPNDPNVVAATVIDCQGSSSDKHRGFNFHSGEGADSIVSGLTITNGYAPIVYPGGTSEGGGISFANSASPTISKCVITNCYASYSGGGIYGGNSSSCQPTIINCTIEGNSSFLGGGVGYFAGDIVYCTIRSNSAGKGGGLCGIFHGKIDNCLVELNSAGEDGGGFYYCSSPISNCVIINNIAGEDGGGGYDCDGGFTNCTIVDNTAGITGGGIRYGNAINCIIWGNSPNQIVNGTPRYSCVQGGSAGEGNIDNDPCFVNAAAGDYHLMAGSPCIDSGHPDYLTPWETDMDGEPRVMGGRVDMGADEFTAALIPFIDIEPTEFVFNAEVSNPEPQVLSVRNISSGTLNWEISEDCPWLQAEPGSGSSTGETDYVNLSVDISGMSIGTYECVLTVSDPCASNNPQIVEVNLNVNGPKIELSETNFHFHANEGGANPAEQIFTIRSDDGRILNWEVTYDCDWLSVEPISGSSTAEPNEVTLSVDIIGLSSGFYSCEIEVTDPNAINSPQIVNIILSILDSDVLVVPVEHETIQEAIDAANAGDTVVVMQGNYTGEGNRDIDFLGKVITVRSVNPDDPCVVAATVVDCEGSESQPHRGFYFHSGEEADSVLAGFTIQNGYVYDDIGGGIYCGGSSPTIESCVIINNVAKGQDAQASPSPLLKARDSYGGGIYLSSSNALISNCSIKDNQAVAGEPVGGGEESDFSGGKSAYGGGIYSDSDSSPIFENCIISGNKALATDGETGPYGEEWGHGGGSAGGGGIFCKALTIENCTISNNDARAGDGCWGVYAGGDGGHAFGGGIYLSAASNTRIVNCAISNNKAIAGHGGSGDMWYASYGGDGGDACGGGIFTNSSQNMTEVQNCTIVGNNLTKGSRGSGYFPGSTGTSYGSGVYTAPNELLYIDSAIVWYNTGAFEQIYPDSLDVDYTNIEGGYAGTGNIDADPCFVNGPLGDYYLSQIAAGQTVDSPCVDTGSDTADNLGMNILTTRTDAVGDIGIVDMGYHYHATLVVLSPDINGDRYVDFVDYALLAADFGLQSQSRVIPRGTAVVDGSLDEWSDNIQWIYLDKIHYGNPNDVTEAVFALRWDPNTNKVYAAVIVDDSDHIFSDEYINWDASDRLEVYSQGDAEGGDGWVWDNDVAQQYFVAPDTTGGCWATWAFGVPIDANAGFEYAVVVDGNLIIYELGITQFDNYGGITGGETVITDLDTGDIVGFDLVASTRSSDTFGMLGENLMTHKSDHADQFARYTLVEDLNTPACSEPPSDLNGDCVISLADLAVLVDSWLYCFVRPANSPSPFNNSVARNPNTVLSWTRGAYAVSHDVYFGTNYNDVDGATPDSDEYMGNQLETSWDTNNYDPYGLELDTTYYWRIDEIGPACTARGDIWNFTTWGEPNAHLAGWWKFDEGGGGIAYDSAGSNNGTISGAVWATGQINGALSFNGDGDYIDLSSSVTLSTNWTFSAWLKTTYEGGTKNSVIIGGPGEYWNFLLISHHEDCAKLETNTNGDTADIFSGAVNSSVGEWAYYTITRSGNVVSGYKNGVFVDDDTLPTGDDNTINKIGAGYGTSSVHTYWGLMDDVRIYDRALDAGEVWLLYQEGL